MNRRTTLSALMGRKITTTKSAASTKLTSFSLAPYTGEWTSERAAHLLRRTMFGPKTEEIALATELGLSGTIDLLFEEKPMPEPPLNYSFTMDPLVPVGETWVGKIYTADEGNLRTVIRANRERSLVAWQMRLLIESEMSIREKMTLFWHNHFVVQKSTVRDPNYLYDYITLLRSNATGNFKQLVKDITVDPAMLFYLNGRQNNRRNPNENYARELLELFTIGKGDLAGPGDYTTFTEDDVIEIARVLTGWRVFDYLTVNPDAPRGPVFVSNLHDLEQKQLSHRFDNVVIENADEEEYNVLIDLIFQKPEVAKFISRKLYRWFIYSEITEEVEQTIIDPMAQLLIENDFETEPVIKTLLSSQHFFEATLIGPMIKNPLDFVAGMFRQFDIKIEGNLNQNYRSFLRLDQTMEVHQMTYLEPPNVAGWKAYYQAPAFYQSWISSATLVPRMQLTDLMATTGYRFSGQNIIIDVLAFAAKVENGTDPNVLIDEFTKILFPQPISQAQKKALKENLIPGLPDFEWTVEYGDYLADPENNDLRTGAENRLRALVKAMLVMPEYYLS